MFKNYLTGEITNQYKRDSWWN